MGGGGGYGGLCYFGGFGWGVGGRGGVGVGLVGGFVLGFCGGVGWVWGWG